MVPVIVVVMLAGQVGTWAQRPVQPHWPGLVGSPPQVWGRVQVPQASMPLHPSPAGPQVTFCCWQVRGAQASGLAPVPHWLWGPAPPQVWGAVQVPHMTMPPHLVSVTAPQLAPSSAQVEGQPLPPSPPLSPRLMPSSPASDWLPPVPLPPLPPVPVLVACGDAEQAANPATTQMPATISPRTLLLLVRLMSPSRVSPATTRLSDRIRQGAKSRVTLDGTAVDPVQRRGARGAPAAGE